MRSRIRDTAAFAAISVLAACTGGAPDHDASAPQVADGRDACAAWDLLGSDGEPRPDSAARVDLAPDPQIVVGTLPNGLRYFIRENDLPGSSASLALAVAAGSALEDPDQLGGAHFLEHMLFNGTERFPKNQLQAVLARLGVQIGSDLNAYTSMDETIYHFDLPNEPQSLRSGLDVLAEWASNATILPADVEAERGVVLEELRSRQGAQQRFFDRVQSLTLAGTRYEDRLPIGTVESLQAIDAGALRRFYGDWYRPDLMTVVAVGDFDGAFVLEEIRTRFAPLDAPGPDARPLPDLSDATFTPRLEEFVDDEIEATSVELIFTSPAEPVDDVEALRASVARDVARLAIEQRLTRAADSDDTPFYDVDVHDFRFVRAFESLMVSVDADPERLGESLLQTLIHLAGLRRDGVAEAEVGRAVETRRAEARTARELGARTQDFTYLDRIIDHAIGGEALTEQTPLAEFELAALDDLSAEEVHSAIRAMTACAGLAIHGGSPASFGDVLPPATDVVDLVADAMTAPALQLAPASTTPAALIARPRPVAPTSTGAVDSYYGGQSIEYPNGARVYVGSSPIESGAVYLWAESPGGRALVDEADLAQARAAVEVVNDSGVGDLDRTTVAAFVEQHEITTTLEIDEANDAIVASAPSAELEAMLQLVHARVTRPRADSGALAMFRGERRLFAENPDRTAEQALEVAFHDLFENGDNRYRETFTPDELASADPERILAVHRDRFGNIGDFVFTIVGDIDIDDVRPLLDSYIGTLPGTDGFVEDVPDIQPVPATRPEKVVRQAGTSDQGTIRVAFDADIAAAHLISGSRRHHADVLAAVVEVILFDRLREELGATYGANVSATLRTRPDIGITTIIEVETEPDRLDEVSAEVAAVLDELRASGPTDDVLARAIAPLRRDAEFWSNVQIMRDWLLLLAHPDMTPAGLELGAAGWFRNVRSETIRKLAVELLPADRSVEVQVLPAS